MSSYDQDIVNFVSAMNQLQDAIDRGEIVPPVVAERWWWRIVKSVMNRAERVLWNLGHKVTYPKGDSDVQPQP